MTVVEPLSATQSSIRCTLYSTQANGTTPPDTKLIDQLHREFKDYVRILEQQASNFTESLNHSIPTVGSSQRNLIRQLEDHVKQERQAGAEIFPAAQNVSSDSSGNAGCGVAERLCKELDSLADVGVGCMKAGSGSQGLAW